MPAAALWICWWAYFNVMGWALSALHQLNAAGYAVALLPLAVFLGIWLKKAPPTFSTAGMARRFRRPLPDIFLFLSLLVFLGGVLYAPGNYDALTYRLPRMLNWLAAGKWHWISTNNARLNYSGTGWEWTAMPLLALTRSDRLLFLIDFSGFLLMPGLLFSIFRQMGLARRVAWSWMWLLPLAFGYVTQAGSISNDLTGAVLCLISVFYGLRARRSGRVEDLWLAVLAAALMTSVKLSNLPLALPCVVAMWPALGLLTRRIAASVCVLAAAVAVSAAPIMALNQHYAGGWTGDPTNKTKMQMKNPVAAFLGNSVLVAEQTFLPPVLPAAHQINAMINRALPASWLQLLNRDYPRFKMSELTELPMEEGAGLGLGVAFLALAGLAGSICRRGKPAAGEFPFTTMPILAASGWIAGLAYMLKMGSEAAPRLMLPFFPLMLIPLLALPGQRWLLEQRAGRILAVLAALGILPGLILSPLRPLWPGPSVCVKLAAEHPGHAVLDRMAAGYSTYANRNDLLAPLRAKLPPDAEKVGFVAISNNTDYSLWRPFGSRQIVYLAYDPEHFLAHPEEVEWFVAKDKDWQKVFGVPLDDWAKTNQFQLTYATNIAELVAWGPERWSVWHREK